MLDRAKSAMQRVMRRYGYEVHRVEASTAEIGGPEDGPEEKAAPVSELAATAPPILSLADVRFVGPEAEQAYRADAREIEARHARQTVADVEELRRRYAPPVFGDMRVWDLVEMLASCIDPSDQRLFGVSQQVHVLQVLEGMERDGIDDPDLLLAALVHDLGKVLLLAGEDPANVVGFNAPIGVYEPSVGLDQCVLQWNHDEFAYSRLREHVPEHLAWLVRYHSIDPDLCEPLMDDADRERARRYLRVFMQYDHGTKTPHHLPRRNIDDYRELVEDAFPKPIPF